MGVYVNYIKDFPGRILKLYDTSLSSAKTNGFEVTFLLSLTASGIAVPLDRLIPNDRPYPDPFEDRNTFKEAADKFDVLCKSSFKKSELWDEAFEEWRYGKCGIGNISPDSWDKISSTFSIGKLIKHLRDSLAHGVIITNGDKEKEINEIQLFTGKKKEGLKVLRVTPPSIEIFLRKWIKWLQTLNVSIWPKNSS
jgi:hypothetical protein